MPKKKDITNQRFGKLVVLYEVDKTNQGRAIWLCQCDCGATKKVDISYLNNGDTKSCGCLYSTKNGFSRNNLYPTWRNMVDRCYNKNNKNYAFYGARGIGVCDRWKDSPENFIKDMGKRPTKHHSLDRADPDKNYSPDNCRWADSSEQGINRRSTVWLTYDGKTLPLSKWAEILGVPVKRLSDRKSAGFSSKEILEGEKDNIIYPDRYFYEEEWREPIEEKFKGLVLISSYGRVYQKERVSSGKKYKPNYTWGSLSNNGYRLFNMNKDGEALFKNVHTMVALAFIDEFGYDRNLVVHHIDGNRENNHVNNLCFCSHSHNVLMRYKN